MASDPEPEKISRRWLSDADAALLTRATVGTVKVGITALALINAAPSAAILAALVAEMGGAMITHREARMAEYLSTLIKKLQSLPDAMKERWQSRFDEEEGRQFFEVAWHQAAETVDPEKVEAIAALVKNSLSAEELQLHHARWLLRLIDQLDAVEIILLQRYSKRYHEDAVFLEKHKQIFESAKEPKNPFHRHSYYSPSYGQPLTEEEQARRDEQSQKFEIERERYALYTSRIRYWSLVCCYNFFDAFKAGQVVAF